MSRWDVKGEDYEFNFVDLAVDITDYSFKISEIKDLRVDKILLIL